VKLLLIPLGIAAFVLFVLVLGALALVVSMTVLSGVGRLWRVLSGSSGRQRA